MRLPIVGAIYQKEMLDLFRNRRTLTQHGRGAFAAHSSAAERGHAASFADPGTNAEERGESRWQSE